MSPVGVPRHEEDAVLSKLPPRGSPQRYAIEFMVISGAILLVYLIIFQGPRLLGG